MLVSMGESPRTDSATKPPAANRDARIASVLETAVDGIVIIDERGTIDTFNPAAEQMFGWTQEEVRGRNVRMLMPEPTAGEHDGYLEAYLRTGTRGIIGIGREVTALRKDGTTFPAQLGVSEFRDGERRLFTGILRDVTEAKRVERELLESKRALSSFIENLPGTAYRCSADVERRLEFVSAGCAAMFGPDPDEMTAPGGSTLEHYVHPDDADVVRTALEAAVRDGEPYRLLHRVRNRAGEVRWVLDHGCLVRGADGAPLAFEGIVIDVTERKQLEQEFLQAQKMEAVGRLAGGIAHDFNNLLTGIISGCTIAESEIEKGRDATTVLGEVRREARRGASMTRQLLDFSRKRVNELQPVHLNDVVSEAEGILGNLIGEDIEMCVELDASEGRVVADAAQLGQILMNLVVNARDAMPQGGRLGIRVLAEELRQPLGPLAPGAYVVLEVSDTGHGMDEATREKIFEPFFTTKERGKGTGLGLSTVFGIVREFAGTVDVRSQPGRGTTFRLYFPRTDAPAVAPAAGAEPAHEPARGSGTILVVEDEPLVRAGIRHFLEKLGYDVRVTGDPQEALRLVDELGSELDLLLTDIVMPGMNGPELARRVAAGLPHVQVAFMSAYSDAALVEQGRIESGIPVLEKPFEEDELAARVRDLLAARRS